MVRTVTEDARSRALLESGGFIEVLRSLKTSLRSLGYAESTVLLYEKAAAHFAVWITRRRAVLPSINETHVAQFLKDHLPKCRCWFVAIRSHHSNRAALKHLLKVLGARAASTCGAERAGSDIDCEVQQFDLHLQNTCGLREATRTYRRRYLREFLTTVFGTGPVNFARMTPRDLVRFVSSRAHHYRPGSTQVLTSSLRSYFRFRQLLGDRVNNLTATIPSVAQWRLSHLPSVLSDEQLSCFLRAFDRNRATGRRDYAMIRCLTDLGLRAGEVAGLRLEDINWRAGTLCIAGGKSRRDDTLPLPASVGRALSAYLHQGRPQAATRVIFITHRPPVGRAVTPMIVRSAVRNAARRAGMVDLVKGTRILRQTLATRILRCGGSLKEVADVLRHRCLDTTTIYTKIDLPRLSLVAMPWPGRRP